MACNLRHFFFSTYYVNGGGWQLLAGKPPLVTTASEVRNPPVCLLTRTANSRHLPLKKGRLVAMTHDYKRHGTTTLFAALEVKWGTVIGD
jgi:hypothetical protein